MAEDVTLNLVFKPNGQVVNETGQDPAIPRVTGYQRYLISADLGQANDYSAVVVIKDQALPIVDDGKIIVGPRERTVVFADRFRGVSYVDVVDYLVRIKNAAPFGGKSDLVIDGTSIGRVVSDMLIEQNVSHNAITMVGGQDWQKSPHGGGRYFNVGKTLLVETLAVLFASGDIRFAPDCPLRDEIEADLASFQVETSKAGNQIITQQRTSHGHGDLGIALVLGGFASQYIKPRNIITQSELRGWY